MELRRMEKAHLTEVILETILNSGRLTFDDETAIRHLIAISTHKPQFSLHIPLFLSLSTAGSLALLSRYRSSVGQASLIAAGTGVVALCALKLLQRSLTKQVEQLLAVLHNTSTLSQTINRWILDNEVLQRGYAVATTGLTSAGGEKERRFTSACLRLRHAAFVEYRVMVFVLRAAAFDLLREDVGTDGTRDASENHICAIPLEEFGDCFCIAESEGVALRLSTDGFSLQAIKSLIGLLDLQASELLKLLCTRRLTQQSFLDQWLLRKRLKTTHRLLNECYRRLESEYHFESEVGKEKTGERKPANKLNGPPNYLRSLELHLTAALKDVRVVEKSGGVAHSTDELEKVVQGDRLEKVVYHVKCCTLLLDYLNRKSAQVYDQTVSSNGLGVPPSKPDYDLANNVARCDDDISVQDEIFEALVMDDVEAEHRGEPVFSQFHHLEEQKQQSQMVLEEIKSLLTIRSADWREREKRARERQGLPLTENDEDEQKVPSYSSQDPEDFQASLDAVFGRRECEGDGLVSQMDTASSAASLGSLWSRNREDQFGEVEDDLQEDESGANCIF